MAEENQVIEKLREIAEEELTELENIVTAYLYGSVARGDQHKHSDIDIGVLFEEKPEWRETVEIKSALEKEFDRKIEVEALNQDNPRFLHKVISEGKVLYEKNPEKRVDFEVNVARQYQDLKPSIYQYWKERRKRLIGNA
jgi:predicted nucleotidyltransferase